MNASAPPPLDFAVIGAAKSGTTTLFHHLRHHPSLHLPPDKEVPFFSRDDWYERGWGWWAPRYLGEVEEGSLTGTVTPQYMEDAHRVPGRMREHNPRLKLVALLRDPVDRAHSLWRMMTRVGHTKLSFGELVERQLDPEEVERRRLEDWTQHNTQHRILVSSEYAYVLERYLEHFPSDQLLVLFTDDLRSDPQGTVDAVCGFLGLEPGFVPQGLGKQYHVGGSNRLAGLHKTLRRFAPLRAAWRLLPLSTRRAILFWYRTEAAITKQKPEPIPRPVRQRLIDHYRPDVARLEEIAGRPVPWADLRVQRAGAARDDGR